MLNLLLERGSLPEIIIVLGIMLAGLIIAVLIVVFIRRMERYDSKMISKKEPKQINLTLKKEYLDVKELSFLSLLHKALPPEFIAFPRVGLSNLVAPHGDKISYNLIYTEFVDVCVFAKDTMTPIVVVDLYKTEAVHEQFNSMSKLARKSLQKVNLPILEVNIAKPINLDVLRRQLIEKMPDTVTKYLKEKLF